MTDNELEAGLIACIKTMREATRSGQIQHLPDLQQKLLAIVTKYMTN